MRQFEPREPPVSVGEEIDVQIEAVGEKGDGIAKVKGFVLFVPNVKAGDQVRVRVTKVLRKVGFAEVVGEAESPVEEAQEQTPEEETEETSEETSQESQEDFSEDFGEEEQQ